MNPPSSHNQPDPPPAAPPLSPHAAKRQFRSFLPIFASFWRDANQAAPEDSAWPDYLRVLLACQRVLDHAPMHPNEAKQINAEYRFEKALETLATALSPVLPLGLGELGYYVVDEATLERRRQMGLNQYKRAKRRRKHARRH